MVTSPAGSRDRLARGALIPLAALVATLPLLLKGPSCGHDFDFHILSWLEAGAQLAHGSYPHWAYTPAFNAGEPRFLFYPPLSWLLGAVLGLLLPWVYVPAAFTFVALTLSGLTAHSLARRYAGSTVALLAAVLYLANPYMLFTAYERTAYGELLAAAWLPLLFAAALAQRVRVLALAVPVALLWLTNAPAGVMGCYALAILLLVRLVSSLRAGWKPALRQYAPGVAGVLLGLGMAGFYLVPAVAERALIQPDMALVTGMRIADSTLFHHMLPATADTAYHDQVVRSASLIACMLLVSLLVLLAISARRRATGGGCVPALLVLTAVVAFLLTPASLVVWAHLPELRFLQFSWRLCALLAPTLVLLFALAMPRTLALQPSRQLACAVLLTSVLAAPAWLSYRQVCSLPESVATQVTQFKANTGVEATDEYTPAIADNDALQPHHPGYWVIPAGEPDAEPANAYAMAATPGSAPRRLHLTLRQPALLVLNLRNFPLWTIRVNGRAAQPHDPERVDGLLTLALPAGQNDVELSQHGSPAQLAGVVLSLFSTLAALELARRGRDRRTHFAHPSAAA